MLDGEEAARIEREYQPTELRMAGQGGKQEPAVSHMLRWIDGQQRWLTVLGDYGVGKTWMLKKLFFELARRYRTDHRLLPLFVPLQRFRKAIGFSNLVLDVLEQNGLHGVSFAAIDYLARQGRLVFLFDSFDEMASSLSQRVIQENLQTLLDGVRASKAILTSRPTYFERRAERVRVVERDRHLVWDVEDDAEHAAAVAAGERLGETFAAEGQARLLDLTPAQRRKLFDTVLRDQPEARAAVEHIDRAYTRIQGLSQKAVIARLLVSVARELGGRPADSEDGPPLLSSDEATRLNSAKLFDLIIRSLITRDLGVGSLNRAERRRFLRTLAVRLQQKGASPFVGPAEMRTLVRTLFEPTLRGVEDAEQEIESRYRVCRRHSGLTTEAQFGSSQDLDVPVEADDTDSNVGFSHNSLREYLVAEAIVEHLEKGVGIEGIENVQISDAVAGFLRELRTWHPRLEARLAEAFAEARQSTRRSFLFRLLVAMAGGAPTALARLLGDPPDLSHLVLANDDLSGLELRNGSFAQSILIDVDLSRSDLRAVDFGGAAIMGAVLDDARIEDADFRAATVESLYVFDRWGTRTRGVLQGRDARQWLYSNGARVAPTDDLNPLLGRPRYEVARAVARHIRLQASFHERGLISGISQRNQEDAGEVVELLRREGVIERLHPSDREGWVMRVNTAERDAIQRFLDLGELSGGIDRALRGFLASELNRDAAR